MKSTWYEDYFYIAGIFKSNDLKFLKYKYEEALDMYDNMVIRYSQKLQTNCPKNISKQLFKHISALTVPTDYHNALKIVYRKFYETENTYKNMIEK